MEDQPITVVAYDPRWPSRFQSERAVLEAAIGELIHGGVHHVGSTAVPGLEAKPIIDILVGVRDLESSRAGFGALAAIGYSYAPHLADEMHWFCKPDPLRRTHHLHLVPAASPRYRHELAFRDYLRAHPDVAAQYASLKRALAERFEHERDAYTAAKAGFIQDVIARALAGEQPGGRLAR